MLEALYQNWMQDPNKRKWMLTYIPLILSFALLGLLAWQIANLYWFFKKPVDQNATPTAITTNNNASAKNKSNYDINVIKNSNLFGKYQEVVVDEAPQEVTTETNLQLTLNGTLVSTKAEDSLAIIKKDNEEKVYKAGDELQPNVSVDSIYASQVIINNRGKKESLNLPKEELSSSRPASRQPTRQVSRSANRLANQLKKDALSNPTKITDILRLKKGKLSSGVQGFRIYPGKERQKFNTLGLKPGDFITAVNGQAVAEQNPFQLFQMINNSPYINLSIERNGNPVDINFDLAQTQ